MPLSAEELVNALHEAAAAKNVDNFVAIAGVLEDQVDETFVQQKKGQLRRVIKLYRQIQKEQDGWPIKITDILRHERSRVKAAICSSALERFSHRAPLLISESARARDGAASTFPSEATAPTRHRPLLPQTAGICGGIPPPTRPPEALLWRHAFQTL